MVMSNATNSVITLRFYQAADSPVLNKRANDVIKTGIYSGGYLTRINDSSVSVSPLVCEIQDKPGNHDQVRAETTQAITVSGVSSSTPYIVLRWTYTGVVDTDFLELVAVATPDDYELVVGKADYSGSVMQTTFNYGSGSTIKRSTPRILDSFCRVEPEETPSMYVRIREGVVQIGNDKVVIYDQLSSVFTAPGAGSATGAVYITESGSVAVSSDFTYAGQLVLAEIALTAGQTQITEDDITDVRPFLTHPKVRDYLTAYEAADQLSGVTSMTKVTLGTVVKQSGITFSSSRATLLANKTYVISYMISFQQILTTPPHTARISVVSGDTSWNLENMSYSHCETSDQAEEMCLTGMCYITPSSNTVIQLEASTSSSGQTGKIIQAQLTIHTI